MAWVCPLCGEINDNDESWDCSDCGKRKPGVPEMDAPPKTGASDKRAQCLRCMGALVPATLSTPLKLTLEGGDKPRGVAARVCDDCGDITLNTTG